MKSFFAVALSLALLLGGVALANTSLAQATEVSTTTYPLTGLPAEDTNWRTVAVSVNSAAPNIAGISSASIVYEVLAQGSQTSLSLLFNSIWEMPMTGPVDQASDILWQFALPQNSILIQNGWNVYAENLLNCYAYQPVDAQIEGTAAFSYQNWGDSTLANEYSWYTTNVAAYQALDSYGVSAEGETADFFTFVENSTADGTASSLWLQYSASAGNLFEYDSASGLWVVSTISGALVDANNGEAVAFENVFVLSAESSVKDDGYTREYDLTEGTGIYLTEGTWQTITWRKGDVTDTLVLLDDVGGELVVNTGSSYIGIYGGFTGQQLILATDSGTVYGDIFN